jgi:hypothetical protein
VPQSTDLWKISGRKFFSACFKDDVGILSGPMALNGLLFFSNFSTPSTVIFRFCVVEPARCGSTVVEIFGFGFVKTDLN